jgi:hypothetical protein
MIKFVLGMLFVLPFTAVGNAADITPLKDAHFVQDDDVKCLMNALENGNPDTGPSMFLLKAPAGCRVAAHYHTAEEVRHHLDRPAHLSSPQSGKAFNAST